MNEQFIKHILSLVQDRSLPRAVAQNLLRQYSALHPAAAQETQASATDNRIAVIGMAARMPMADSAEQFWEVLASGKDCVRPLPAPRRPDVDAHYAGYPEDAFLHGKRYWDCAYLEQIDLFAAEHFGIPAAEARGMDPAHRLFLEVALEAFEDAGYAGERIRHSNTGVYVSNSMGHYEEALEELDPLNVPGNVPAFLGSRVSYVYDLKGPSFGTLATCSSSLVAVHLACAGLRSGDCDMALVGGAILFAFPGNLRNVHMTAAGIVSPDERCRPFAQGANGMGRGEGVVALLLKPYAKAVADGDSIHAVILGSAINNDGRSAGLTAPNPLAHAELLKAAWANAGVEPKTISYIEAHGTGTALGDPIEIMGINKAFEPYTQARQFCGIGSVKGNIGHLVDGAAGISGCLKAILALKHRQLPPTLHLKEPNEHIDFLGSAVYPVDRLMPWEVEGHPRRIGVNSFGFNGTNAHVVLEEAPAVAAAPEQEGRPYPFVLSARTPVLLRELARRHVEHLARVPGQALGDLCYTLATGRELQRTRLALVVSSREELASKLRRFLESNEPRTDEAAGLFYGEVTAASATATAPSGSPLEAARSFVVGAPLSAGALFGERPHRRVSLPPTPLQRERYWVDPPKSPKHRQLGAAAAPTEAPPGQQEPITESSVHARVAELWREALGSAGTPSDRGFFEAGGSSLLAMQLVARCRKQYGVEFGVAEFLADPTPEGLARAVLARLKTSPSHERETPAAGGDVSVLSFAQETFWFLDQLEGNSSFYNVPLILRMEGPLDVPLLQRCLTRVAARHEILRARFPADAEGKARMELSPPAEQPLQIISVEFFKEPQRELEAKRIAFQETRRPFNLSAGPVWRTCLIRQSERVHLLVVTMQHIVSDIASLYVLMRDLAVLYREGQGSAPSKSALPAMPRSYPVFAAWQREWMQGAELERWVGFWKRTLGPTPPVLEFPLDRPRPAERRLEGATLLFSLPDGTADSIRELCAREKVTPFMVLLGAFAALLRARTGQEDLLIGTETAGRTRAESEPLIGPFVNQLALRVAAAKSSSFREHLGRVRQTTLDAFAHQELPFEKVVEAVRPQRRANETPLFSVKFLFVNFRDEGVSLPGLSVEIVDTPVEHSPFDFTFRLVEDGPHLRGSLSYSTALFNEQTMSELLADFQQVLRHALTQPELTLEALLPRPEGEAASARAEGPRKPSLKGFKRKEVSLSSESLVKTGFLKEGDRFPLVVRPTVADLEAGAWVSSNRAFVEEKLLAHGALLLRGFAMRTVQDFQNLSLAVHPQLVEYSEPSTPREEYGDKIYQSSDYPNYHTIQVHPELCYTWHWPMKALFFSVKVAAKGGETPIADNREILGRLDPRVRQRFIEKGVMYLRNYGDGVLVPWQKVFKTQDPAQVEAHCRANAPMTCEWKGAHRLRTRQVRPGVAIHPQTKDLVWFNQAHIFHIHSLGSKIRDTLLQQFDEQDLPVNAYYGDGTPFEPWELDDVYKALAESEYACPWEAGDVMLVDNMLMSHGRRSFEGDRKVIVSFVEPYKKPEDGQ